MKQKIVQFWFARNEDATLYVLTDAGKIYKEGLPEKWEEITTPDLPEISEEEIATKSAEKHLEIYAKYRHWCKELDKVLLDFQLGRKI